MRGACWPPLCGLGPETSGAVAVNALLPSLEIKTNTSHVTDHSCVPTHSQELRLMLQLAKQGPGGRPAP